MKSSDIKISDWNRILMGDVPSSFYFELVLRALFIFFLLTICMRIIGKRMSTHINQLELVALVSLASAVGVPMLAPDRGLLPAVLIAVMIVSITTIIAKFSYRNVSFQKFTQGKYDILVEDAVINMKYMISTRISKERLFAHLRSESLFHLGQVKRVYLETNGVFTVIKNDDVKPGLLILPDFDNGFIKESVIDSGKECCSRCGCDEKNTSNLNMSEPYCPNCGGNEWSKAVKLVSEN